MILRILSVIVVITQTWADSSGSYYSGDTYHLSSGKNPRCEEITIPMCRGIGYNLTSYPNEFSHDTQDEAGMEVSVTVLCRIYFFRVETEILELGF